VDEAEQILLTQSFSWGYNSQPPLYTWIQYIYFELFGINIFALSLFKNMLLYLTYFFVYKSAKIVTNNTTLAIIASASLFLLPEISWESQRALTHSVLLTNISSIVIYVIFKIKYSVEKMHIGYYVLLGLLISIGMLTKYNFSIFIFAVFIASLLDPKLRKLMLKKESAITFSIILLLLFPHFLWLSDHMNIITGSTINKLSPRHETFSFVIGVASLFRAILTFLAPLILIGIPIFRKVLDKSGNKFLFHFFITVITTYVFFTLLTGATYFKDRWMLPYFFLMVIYLVSKINIENLKKINLTLYFKIIYFVMFTIIAVMIVRVCFPDLTKGYSRLNYPFYTLSQQIKESGFNHGFIIAGHKRIGGNLKLNFSDSTVSATDFVKAVDKSEKILIIWKEKFPEQAEKYKNLIQEYKVITSPYLYSKRGDYSLNIAIVFNEK